MFCPNCGKNVPDGAKFCGSCGQPMIDTGKLDTGIQQPQKPAQPAQPVRQSAPQVKPPQHTPSFDRKLWDEDEEDE